MRTGYRYFRNARSQKKVLPKHSFSGSFWKICSIKRKEVTTKEEKPREKILCRPLDLHGALSVAAKGAPAGPDGKGEAEPSLSPHSSRGSGDTLVTNDTELINTRADRRFRERGLRSECRGDQQ